MLLCSKLHQPKQWRKKSHYAVKLLVGLLLHLSFALGLRRGMDWGKWFCSCNPLFWAEMGPSRPVFRFLSHALHYVCQLPHFWSFELWIAILHLAQCSFWISSALQVLKDKPFFINTLTVAKWFYVFLSLLNCSLCKIDSCYNISVHLFLTLSLEKWCSLDYLLLLAM